MRVCRCVCFGVRGREERDIGVGVCDTSSLHIRLLQLMHKWAWVSSTPCVLIGVYVCAWERRCCQPAFACVSAHVSLFKHHTLVIWRRRTYGAEQNLVTLLAHCRVYRAKHPPTTSAPPPHHTFVFLLSPPSFCRYGGTAVKEGPPALEPTSLSGYRESLYTADVSVI